MAIVDGDLIVKGVLVASSASISSLNGVQGLGASTGNIVGNTGSTYGTFAIGGTNNITVSQITGANNVHTILISGPTAGAGNLNAISAGTQSATAATIIFSDSNGISFGAAGSATITATADYIRSISAGTTNATGNKVVLSNSNNLSFGANGATITGSFSVDPLSSFMPFPVIFTGTALGSLNTNTSGSMTIYPIVLPQAVAVGWINPIMSMNLTTGGTSSYRQTGSLNWGVFSRGTGTNSTILSQLTSNSLSWQVTYNNSSITVSQPTSTNSTGYGYGSTSSAGLNLSSQYTGLKLMKLAIGTTLTSGNWWIGMLGINSTTSFNSGILVSLHGQSIPSLLASLAPMGSLSTGFSTGTILYGGLGNYHLGGNWSAVGLTSIPATIDISAMSNNLTFLPHMNLNSSA